MQLTDPASASVIDPLPAPSDPYRDAGLGRPDGSAERPVPRRPRRRIVRLGLLGLVGVLALTAAVVFAARSGSPTEQPLTRAQVDKTVADAVAEARTAEAREPARSTLAYERIGPSIVLIETDAAPRSERGAGDASGSDQTGARPSPGLGTGVIVSADGRILTAHHVVADANAIQVTFADGTKANAVIVSAEPRNDIAVLEADRTPEVIVPAVLGGGLRVGDEVYAVGHPLGLVGSLSAGVVSALDRTVPIGDGAELTGLIQFDAAINPGSSGGPLLNRNGQVVGIVTALANPSEQGFFVGIGFAVPIATAGGAAGGPPQ